MDRTYKTRFSMSFLINDKIYCIAKNFKVLSIDYDEIYSEFLIKYAPGIEQKIKTDWQFVERNFY